jgi:hypothetical protein
MIIIRQGMQIGAALAFGTPTTALNNDSIGLKLLRVTATFKRI